MPEPRVRYDESSDTLYVAFAPGESATGIELNENILLRIDKGRRAAVGLTLLNYSLLAQATEIGPRSFPLTGLGELSGDRRELVLTILHTAAVSEFLTVSAYTPRLNEVIPITICKRRPSLPSLRGQPES